MTNHSDNCIFCKIVRGELPSRKMHEDDEVLVFSDIQPVAPLHALIIPKKHIASLDECSEADRVLLGRIMLLAPKIARENGAPDGFRTIVNTGRVGRQEVFHLHVHVIGGPDILPAMIKYD